MDVKTIILGFLNYGEMSGYDIKQLFTNSLSFFYDASFGAIYPALRKLEEEQLVTKQEIIQSGKPNKILYSITEAGKKAFDNEMKTAIQPPVVRSDMLVKIFFAEKRSVDEQKRLLDNCIEYQRALLGHTKRAFEKLENSLDKFQKFSWDFTMNNLEHSIAYLEANREKLFG